MEARNYMINRYDDLTENLQVLHLLQIDIIKELEIIDEVSDEKIISIVIKSLVVDLASIMEEINMFNNTIYRKYKNSNDNTIKTFLLSTYQCRRKLNKSNVKDLRNKVFAHNFREGQKFNHPFEFLTKNIDVLPNRNEIIFLAQIALIIVSEAKKVFHNSHEQAFLDSYNKYQGYINSLKIAQKEIDLVSEIERIKSNMWHIKDAVKSSTDNIETIKQKLGYNQLI